MLLISNLISRHNLQYKTSNSAGKSSFERFGRPLEHLIPNVCVIAFGLDISLLKKDFRPLSHKHNNR